MKTQTAICWCVTVVFVFSAMATPAAAKNWNAATGNWNVPTNWDPLGAPTMGEAVNIVFNDNTARTVTYDVTAPTLGVLKIDLTNGANPSTNSSTLLMPGGFNLDAIAIAVGGYDGTSQSKGRGVIIQSTGMTTTGPNGDLILAWGTDSTGDYTLSGTGALVANQAELIGFNGTGTFTHSAGSNTINTSALGSLILGANGSSTGTYELSGTGILTVTAPEYIGNFGEGFFYQTGGMHTVAGGGNQLFLGNNTSSSGTYTLEAGSLSVGTGEIVGYSGTGIFNQTGGTNMVGGTLYIGNNSGVSGTYTISGGTVSAVSGILVGNLGVGTLGIQSNGSVSTDSLSINNASNVNLNGGTLRFNTVSGTGGLSKLNFNSGTIQLAGNRDLNDAAIQTLFPSHTIPLGRKLVVEGNTTMQIATEFVDGGELVSQGTFTVGATFPGYLKVLNAGKVVVVGSASIGAGASGVNNIDGAGSTWTIGGDLNIGSGDLTIQNQALLNVGGAINFTSGTAGDRIYLNGGTVRFNAYSNTSRLTYTAGTIQMSGDRSIGTDATIAAFYGSQPTIPTGKQLTVEGIATIAASSKLTLSGGTLAANTLLMSPGSRLATSQSSQALAPVIALAGSVIDATGGDLVLGDAAKVNGFYGNGSIMVGTHTVSLSDSNDAVFDSAALVTLGDGGSPGTLNAVNGLTLDFGGNITGYGTVSTPNNVAKPLINNGHITGDDPNTPITLPGYVKGVGTFDNVVITGTFSPGLSPTILTVGNVALSPTSTLVMELGGTSPGSGYDQIISSAGLEFDGTLALSLINGFSPAVGQSFNLFDWFSTSGTFDTLALPALASLTWNTAQLYTTGVLSVVAGLAGDFDFDGDVDGRDFLIWQHNPSVGNLSDWEGNYGFAPSLAASATAVPEPSCGILLLISTIIGLGNRRRRMFP